MQLRTWVVVAMCCGGTALAKPTSIDGTYKEVESPKVDSVGDLNYELPDHAVIKDGTIKILYVGIGSEMLGHAEGTVDADGKIDATGEDTGFRDDNTKKKSAIHVTGKVTCKASGCDAKVITKVGKHHSSTVILTTDQARINPPPPPPPDDGGGGSAPSAPQRKPGVSTKPAAPQCHPRNGYSCRIGTNCDCHKDEVCVANPRAKSGAAYNGLCACK
jgi:hypothetical protein